MVVPYGMSWRRSDTVALGLLVVGIGLLSQSALTRAQLALFFGTSITLIFSILLFFTWGLNTPSTVPAERIIQLIFNPRRQKLGTRALGERAPRAGAWDWRRGRSPRAGGRRGIGVAARQRVGTREPSP